MKQKSSLISLTLFIIAIIFFISGCTTKVQIPSEPSSQFDIYYSFGVGENNVLDTKNNLYVKDMICDPLKEYDFQLTEPEKSEIYNSILENDLFNIKDEFIKSCYLGGICQQVTPLSTATLKITVNGKTTAIKWSANYINREDPELKKFQNVEKIIQNIISQKEEEMNIKQPTCGYL